MLELGYLRRATWSPTNLCYAGYTPHEGCEDASHPSAIVGLMINNLSEVSTSFPALYTPKKASLPASRTALDGFIVSERLFLDNPTMDGTASADTGLRGDTPERYSLVGDHVSVLHVPYRSNNTNLRNLSQVICETSIHPRGDYYKNMFAKCPAGRPGTADEVANVAKLLMRQQGAFITGADII